MMLYMWVPMGQSMIAPVLASHRIAFWVPVKTRALMLALVNILASCFLLPASKCLQGGPANIGPYTLF